MAITDVTKLATILIAEDDPDDRLLAKDALAESQLLNDVHFVEDGVDLMDYLLGSGCYREEPPPKPGLIILDLNMPRKDGREALFELKSHLELRRIPVVVMTTSRAEEDILRSYDLGVNSFIVKPLTFERLVEVMEALGIYWFQVVELPH